MTIRASETLLWHGSLNSIADRNPLVRMVVVNGLLVGRLRHENQEAPERLGKRPELPR